MSEILDASDSNFSENLRHAIDDAVEADFLNTLDSNRPYDGQPHTDLGIRGKQEIHGITMRDLRDCFIRACYDASGLETKDYPKDLYDLPWDDMDIIAVLQNMACWVERYMGIFPNLPEPECSEWNRGFLKHLRRNYENQSG